LGHKVAFVHPSYNEESTGVYSYRSPLGVWAIPNIIDPQVFKKIDRFKPDIIHTHGPDVVGIAAIRYAFDKNLPVIFTAHTDFKAFVASYMPWTLKFWLPHLFFIWIRNYINLCDTVIAPTKTIKGNLIKAGIKTRIVVQPSGIDLAKFRYRPRKTVGRKVNILFVGAVVKLKNVQLLVNMMRFLDPDRFSLTIVGGGSELNRLKELAGDLQLNNVNFCGPISNKNVPKYYKKADVFATASVVEVQPIVYIEAMAAGLPIVALKNLGSCDVIKGSRAGVVINRANPRVFAREIKRLTKDEDLYSQFSKRSYEYAGNYDLKRTIPATIKIYERTLRCYQRERSRLKESFLDRFVHKVARAVGFID
jgi:1,2-diacylglycerol 3-alpha-glucosyltransferase